MTSPSSEGDKNAASDKRVTKLVERFRAGALRCSLGMELEEKQYIRRGEKLMIAAYKDLKALGSDVCLSALTPLLEDPEPYVRLHTATNLLIDRREQALVVLRDIIRNGPPGAFFKAEWALELDGYLQAGWRPKPQ